MRQSSNTAEKLEEKVSDDAPYGSQTFDLTSDLQITNLIKQFSRFSLFATLESISTKDCYDL